VGVAQTIVGTDMNLPRHLARWRLDAFDVALRFEPARHLATEVDIHRFISMRRVMIEEQVVSGLQVSVRLSGTPIHDRAPTSMFEGYR
jgi:hypothetical protein